MNKRKTRIRNLSRRANKIRRSTGRQQRRRLTSRRRRRSTGRRQRRRLTSRRRSRSTARPKKKLKGGMKVSEKKADASGDEAAIAKVQAELEKEKAAAAAAAASEFQKRAGLIEFFGASWPAVIRYVDDELGLEEVGDLVLCEDEEILALKSFMEEDLSERFTDNMKLLDRLVPILKAFSGDAERRVKPKPPPGAPPAPRRDWRVEHDNFIELAKELKVNKAIIDAAIYYAVEQPGHRRPVSANIVKVIKTAQDLAAAATYDVADETTAPPIIAVIGYGRGGAGVAMELALCGCNVRVYDDRRDEEKEVDNTKNQVVRMSDAIEAYNKASGEKYEVNWVEYAIKALNRITFRGSLQEAVEGCQLVTECLTDQAPNAQDLKIKIFRRISDLCPPNCLLTTNTTQCSIPAINEELKNYAQMLRGVGSNFKRVIGLRFLPPIIFIPLIEVVYKKGTEDQELNQLLKIMSFLGKKVWHGPEGPPKRRQLDPAEVKKNQMEGVEIAIAIKNRERGGEAG